MYMKQRYHKRREQAVKTLGGKCVRCGSTDDLQVDHIDRVKKTMKFARMTGVSESKFLEELARCQLLCQECHTTKTVEEDLGRKRRTHGTVAMYQHGKCRCGACKKAKAADWAKHGTRWKLGGEI